MMNESNPVFVKVDKYKEILSVVDVIDKKIKTVRQLIDDVQELKNREEEEILEWEKNLEEITYKMEAIQDQLFQG